MTRYCKDCESFKPEKHFKVAQFDGKRWSQHTPGMAVSEEDEKDEIIKAQRQKLKDLEKRLTNARSIIGTLKDHLERRLEPGYKYRDWLDNIDPDEL